MPDIASKAMNATGDRRERLLVRSVSETQTEGIGAGLGRRLAEGVCVSLTGPLGSGKSILARGICRGLDVDETVVSPSFILYEEYRGRLSVVHCDLYRLEHEKEIEELGVFERIGNGSVVLVEWGDRSPRLSGLADIRFHLAITGDTERTIAVEHRARLKPLFENLRS